LGAKQVFVRFYKCNLACAYCDEKRAGSKSYLPEDLFNEVKFLELSKGPHHSISLTGGEPLLYAEFLKIFLKMVKKEHMKTYLETNGTLPQELTEIIDLIDIIAMDFKLPSSTGQRDFWKEHAEFLSIGAKKKIFVKAVVTAETKEEDIDKAISLVRLAKGSVPLVLQPATPVTPHDKPIAHNRLMEFVEMGLKNKVENIRVIPQIHKILNIK